MIKLVIQKKKKIKSRVSLDRTYFAKIENLLLKTL